MADLIENRTFMAADIDEGGGAALRALAGHELYRCTFRGLKLAEAPFPRCVLEACTFDECDLTRATLVGVSLRGVVFRATKLLGVDFSAVNDHPDVAFERCILRYARFEGLHLRGVRFDACELQEAHFVDTSLVDADFAGSDLAGASFTKCDLAGADLSHATHAFLDARANHAKGALIAVETAVLMAQALGVRVAGYESARPAGKGRGRR